MNAVQWFVLYTKPQEEDRAEQNLKAWGVQSFNPKIKKAQINQFTGKATYVSQPLFPRYIFARFDVEKALHKIYYTRGVQKVVSCNGIPTPVNDDVIALIQSKVADDGFVRLEDELRRGDEVQIKDGSMRGINGVFARTMKDTSRVMILLNAINYQASVIVARDLVQKTNPSFCTTT